MLCTPCLCNGVLNDRCRYLVRNAARHHCQWRPVGAAARGLYSRPPRQRLWHRQFAWSCALRGATTSAIGCLHTRHRSHPIRPFLYCAVLPDRRPHPATLPRLQRAPRYPRRGIPGHGPIRRLRHVGGGRRHQFAAAVPRPGGPHLRLLHPCRLRPSSTPAAEPLPLFSPCRCSRSPALAEP